MNREKLLRKLTVFIGEDNYMTKITANILAVNYVKVANDITISKAITPTGGVLQGDTLGLLFNIATIDELKAIKPQEGSCSVYMYADDMVITGKTYTRLVEKFR
jgi:hypothetical protein